MTFAEDLVALRGVYAEAQLLAYGPTVDPTRDIVSQGSGGHNKHGATSAHLSLDGLPLAVEMEQFLARALRVWRRRLERVRVSDSTQHMAAQDKTSDRRRERTEMVLAEVGKDPTEVAYLHGMTTQGVHSMRQRRGLDPETGLPVVKDLLTARPSKGDA